MDDVALMRTQGRLSVKRLLLELQDMGVKSLMVEGGASVISSFIGSGLVDRLVVTVCPTLVGDEGVAYNVGTVSYLLLHTFGAHVCKGPVSGVYALPIGGQRYSDGMERVATRISMSQLMPSCACQGRFQHR